MVFLKSVSNKSELVEMKAESFYIVFAEQINIAMTASPPNLPSAVQWVILRKVILVRYHDVGPRN
jgi:hypothetical protein